MNNAINNVLFDLDGTLVDTAGDLAQALNRTLLNHGREALPHEAIRPYVSLGGMALVKLGFGPDRTEPEFDALREELLASYSDKLCQYSRLFPGMERLLDRLDETGVAWGIVTNKPGWLTNPLMQALQLDERAGCIVSGDTLEQRKPHPAPLLHACELLRRRPVSALYVGDARRDIEAGLSAGMTTLVAAYGYIGAGEDPATWGAHGYVNAPAEILPWIYPDATDRR